MTASAPTVLVLGSADDPHAAHVLGHLLSRGAGAHLVDSAWFPQNLRLALDADCHGEMVLPDGSRIDLGAINSVYWRNYNGVLPPAIDDPGLAEIAHNDSRSLFESLFMSLPARWVNSWHAYQLHQRKPAALAIVRSLDLPPEVRIPDTLQLNDADALRQFAARHPRAIFKPVQGGAHTRPLTAEHLSPENLAALSVSPVTVQERIMGTDVRVFVAGERILACEIDTTASDFRDDREAPISACTLPDVVGAACIRIARALDLLWTGIDLKRTAEGAYYFLEANFSAMFMEFEARSGLPLTESLCDLLLGRESTE